MNWITRPDDGAKIAEYGGLRYVAWQGGYLVWITIATGVERGHLQTADQEGAMSIADDLAAAARGSVT